MSALNSQETLILIGAAVAAGCRPCLDTALGLGLELNIEPGLIARAQEIGNMAANRARSDMAEHAEKTLAEFVPQGAGFAGQAGCASSAAQSCKCSI